MERLGAFLLATDANVQRLFVPPGEKLAPRFHFMFIATLACLCVGGTVAIVASLATSAGPPTVVPSLFTFLAYHGLCVVYTQRFSDLPDSTMLIGHGAMVPVTLAGILSAHSARYGQLPGGVAKKTV